VIVCDKASYSTKEKAESLARKLKYDRDMLQYAYRCPECKRWHLTTNRKMKNPKTKRGRVEREVEDVP
jgi:hypothetical protein